MALVEIRNLPGYVEDTEKGLLIPASYATRSGNMHMPGALQSWFANSTRDDKRISHGRQGTTINIDSATGIPFWPTYASGFDDFMMRAMVQGYLANASPTPLPITLLSTIVTKIQGMVGTWVNTVRGKKTPVKRIIDIMAQANDSQFGSAEYVRDHMGALCVDNRGSISAQVPIGIIDVDNWEGYGMMLEPIGEQNSPQKPHEQYVLRMTNEAFRENRGLWSIDGLTCVPTGNSEYPYWIKKYSLKERMWFSVLVHRDFGFQITQQVAGRNELYPGYGQSGTWRFSPYAMKFLVIDRGDWEKLINQPPEGIFMATGMDTSTQLKESLTAFKNEQEDGNLLVYPGVFFLSTRNPDAKIQAIPWREPPSGYTPENWDNQVVSKLAASFHMNETHLQLKLGEGALTQSGVAESLEAETAVAWQRQMVEMVWNHLAPPRVMVNTIWQSDRQRRFQIESFNMFARGVAAIENRNRAQPETEEREEPVMTSQEIKALITSYIGIEIPNVVEESEITTDKHGSEDLSASPLLRLPRLDRLDAPTSFKYAVGTAVLLADGSDRGCIISYRAGSPFIWIKTERGEADMLVSPSNLIHIASPNAISIRPISFGFVPEGDPLPPAEMPDISEADREEAELAWLLVSGDELLTADYDEEARLYAGYTYDQVVGYRDDAADEWGFVFSEESNEISEENITGMLIAGILTLPEWEHRMRLRILDTNLVQYAITRGGFSQMVDIDYQSVNRLVFDQWSFLSGFALAISSGEKSEAEIFSQTRLYFSDTVRSAEVGRGNAFDYDMLLPAYPGDCSSECCARDRCYWMYVDMGDTIEATWIRTSAESCRTCAMRSSCKPVVFVKETGEHLNTECYN